MSKNQRRSWRLYQFLVACGVVSSKHEAAMLARANKITVNGSVMQSLFYQIRPFRDEVKLDGKLLVLRDNRAYFVLNKPEGVETTKHNLIAFIKSEVAQEDYLSFSPVGRLDKATTGLIIITNDGRIGKRMLDPKTKRAKVYQVLVKGEFTKFDAAKLEKGVEIEVDDMPYVTLPAKVKFESSSNKSVFTITIIEGKKRQVRKMCLAVGHKVLELQRVAIAKVKLGDLQSGEVKEYTKKEIYGLLFE